MATHENLEELAKRVSSDQRELNHTFAVGMRMMTKDGVEVEHTMRYRRDICQEALDQLKRKFETIKAYTAREDYDGESIDSAFARLCAEFATDAAVLHAMMQNFQEYVQKNTQPRVIFLHCNPSDPQDDIQGRIENLELEDEEKKR